MNKIQSIYLKLLPDFSIVHKRILNILNDDLTKNFNIIADYYRFHDDMSMEMDDNSSSELEIPEMKFEVLQRKHKSNKLSCNMMSNSEDELH